MSAAKKIVELEAQIASLQRRLDQQEIATLAMQTERDKAQIAMHQIQLAYIDKALPSAQASFEAGQVLLERKRKEFQERYQ